MSHDQRARSAGNHPPFEFSDVDPRETSKAWNRFLANRNAPTLPMPGVRSIIYQSWVRSNTRGVKPDQYAAPSLERDLRAYNSNEVHDELRRATRASMAQIGALLSSAEAMLILTDRDGLILETVGDNSTLTKAYKINLSVGGIWSEKAAGTNGIGTALWTGMPVFVHGEEHFCEGMKPWSCAAAPIRDPIDRSIIGVINLSGLTSIFQKHNAAFAATAARDIEVALEQEQSLLNIRLMESIIGRFPAQSLQPSERLAIVDRFGRLIFNRGSGAEVLRSDHGSDFGTRLLDLQDGMSEEKILAALPTDHDCKDIRLINLDGEIRGAALVFKVAAPSRSRAGTRPLPDLPGLAIAGTDLKIVGNSDAILEALDAAERIAKVTTPTLIEGETGVGKELFARLIHSRMDAGNRHPFAAVNCGAVTPQMFRDGALRPQETGYETPICLDEVGELPPDMQPFLLRVLEDQLAGKEGQDRAAPQFRVVSLTNRILLAEVEAGRFRRDLFYRLGTVILKIPPLRDRGDDILLIAEHYNRKIHAETGLGLLDIGPEVQDALMSHSWPGNVRELRNVISGMHFLSRSRQVSLDDLPREIASPSATEAAPHPASRASTHDSGPAVSLKHSEIRLIESSLAQFNGNISKTAAALGISRPTLYRKIQTLGISAESIKPKWVAKT